MKLFPSSKGPYRLSIRATALVLLLLGLSGCFMHHHKQIGGALLDDKVTTDRVEAALKASGDKELQTVRVGTTNGVVTLGGSVSSEAAKAKAGQLAQTVHRINKLQNDIQVRH